MRSKPRRWVPASLQHAMPSRMYEYSHRHHSTRVVLTVPCSTACPPCTELGPERKCGCGSTAYQLRCGEVERGGGRSCGAPCDRLLSCGKHRCRVTCHIGPCQRCDQT